MRTKLMVVGTMALVPFAALAVKAPAEGGQATAKQQQTEAWCTKVQSRITTRVSNTQADKTKLDGDYTKVVEHVQNIITKGSGAGVDTNKLQSDLATYQSDTAAVDSAFTAHTDDLNQILADAPNMCGKSHGAFAGELKNHHQSWQAILTARKTTHNFVKSTLRADVKAVISNAKYPKTKSGSASAPAAQH